MTSLDPTLLTGPLLLGHLFNSILYGVEIVQFYRYHTFFPNDFRWTRRLVYTVVFLDTLQTGFAYHNAWKILGPGWGKSDQLLNPEWSWGAVPLFTGIVSLLVQGFYAYRISKLIQSKFTKWIVAIIILLSVAQGFCGVFSGVYYALGSVTIAKNIITAVMTFWLGGTAMCDFVITTTIVTFLLVKLSGFTPSDNVVSRVIRMTVEIGAITTSAATIDLILFLLYTDNNLHLIFCIPLAKIYSNTLLAMLNARKGSFLQDSASPDALPTINIGSAPKRHSNPCIFSRSHSSSHSNWSLDTFHISQQTQGEPLHIKATQPTGLSMPSLNPTTSALNTSTSASGLTAYELPNTSLQRQYISLRTPNPTIPSTREPILPPHARAGSSNSNSRAPNLSSTTPRIPPRPEKPVLTSSFIAPHRRNLSSAAIATRPTAQKKERHPSLPLLAMPKIPPQRPTKAQANANFDQHLPCSHLDLTPSPDEISLKTWIFHKISR